MHPRTTPATNNAGYHRAIVPSDPSQPTRRVAPNLTPGHYSAPNLGPPRSAPDLGPPRHNLLPADSDLAPTVQSTPVIRPAPRAPSDPGPPKTMIAEAVSVPPPASSPRPPRTSAAAASQNPDSLQIPVSRGARYARIGVLLAVDAALIVFGIVFLMSYLDARAAAARNHADSAATSAPPRGDEPGEARLSVESAVGALVDRHKSDIQRCYRQAADAQPEGATLEGRLDIGITIDKRGALTRADAQVNETGSTELATCVSELFLRFALPGPPDRAPVELTWPLRFKAPK